MVFRIHCNTTEAALRALGLAPFLQFDVRALVALDVRVPRALAAHAPAVRAVGALDHGLVRLRKVHEAAALEACVDTRVQLPRRASRGDREHAHFEPHRLLRRAELSGSCPHGVGQWIPSPRTLRSKNSTNLRYWDRLSTRLAALSEMFVLQPVWCMGQRRGNMEMSPRAASAYMRRHVTHTLWLQDPVLITELSSP